MSDTRSPKLGDSVRLRFENNTTVTGPLYRDTMGNRCVKGYIVDCQHRSVECV